jgi:hypothetical protein
VALTTRLPKELLLQTQDAQEAPAQQPPSEQSELLALQMEPLLRLGALARSSPKRAPLERPNHRRLSAMVFVAQHFLERRALSAMAYWRP